MATPNNPQKASKNKSFRSTRSRTKKAFTNQNNTVAPKALNRMKTFGVK